MPSNPVFYDPKQARSRNIRVFLGVMLVLVLVVGGGFTYSLFIHPHLPKLTLHSAVSFMPKSQPSLARERVLHRYQMSREHTDLLRAISL